VIPKNIIQVYLGRENNDYKYLMHLAKKWKIDYPDWNHKVYKEEDILLIAESIDPAIKSFYKTIPLLSYRADFARLILLYKLGGVYIDLDTRPNVSLEEYVIQNKKTRWGMCLTIDPYSKHESDSGQVVTNNHLAIAEKESLFIRGMLYKIMSHYETISSSLTDPDEVAGMWAARIMSTSSWGDMLISEINRISGNDDFLKNHINKYGQVGIFWITYDGEKISTRKERDFVIHIGSLLLKDFADTTPNKNVMEKLAKLYDGLSPHNGEIKIYSEVFNHGI
jgi:hypothetical protein